MFRPLQTVTATSQGSSDTSFTIVPRRIGYSFKAHEFHVRFKSQISEIKKIKSKQPLLERVNDVFVLGAGCIGQGLTASLLKSNIANRVFLVGKAEHVSKIQKTGINLLGVMERNFIPDDHFVLSDKINNDLLQKYKIAPKPIVFSATKASDAASSLRPFQQTLAKLSPTIICLQNGLGVEQEIEKVFPPFHAKVLKGHVFGAIHKKMESIFAYKGRIIVEHHNDDCSKKLKTIFGPQDISIFNLEISPNILQAIYPKIAVNCVCNPLTVILNQNLGFIRNQYEPLIRMICSEIFVVALSQGVDLSSSENLAEIVLDTMSKFSSHYSSMYLDHQSGRVSEIEYINGAILRIAHKKKIHVPLNQLLTNSMKEIEKRRMVCNSAEEFYQRHASYLENVKTQLLAIASPIIVS